MNNKGFGAVEIILIVVLVGVLGFVGYRAYDVYTNKSDEGREQDKYGFKEEEKEYLVIKDNTKEVTHIKVGVKFSIPKDWTLVSEETNDYESSVEYATPDYVDGPFSPEKGASISIINSAKSAENESIESIVNAYKSKNVPSADITVAGKPAKKFLQHYEELEQRGMFEANNRQFTVVYRYPYTSEQFKAGVYVDPTYLDEFETVLDTLKLL